MDGPVMKGQISMLLAPNNTNNPSLVMAMRKASRMTEPMRTRVLFYLSEIIDNREDKNVSTHDMDSCIGRAYQDKMNDDAIKFNIQNAISASLTAKDGTGVITLKEIITNGVSG